MPKGWEDVIGQRVLIRRWGDNSIVVDEATVLAFSPSLDFMQLRYPSGAVRWRERNDYIVLEVLGPAGEASGSPTREEGA